MYSRRYDDWIILSTLPHFYTVWVACYYGDYIYSVIVGVTTFASICWHESRESSFEHLIVDYLMTGLLVGYESLLAKSDFLFVIECNVMVFTVNKMFDFLSGYDILEYDIGHGVFHIVSALKTYYIAETYLGRNY